MFTSRKKDGSQGRRRNQANSNRSIGLSTAIKMSSVYAAYDTAVTPLHPQPVTTVAATGVAEPNAQINLNSSSNSAGRPSLARASKLGGGVQFNVESDESDDDDYQEQEHKQIVEDETIRYWIFAQYCGVLCAPDSDEWEDFAGERGLFL